MLHGAPLRIPWVRDGKLEIWMAAYGPKALALVGEQADGFILQTADPDIARWTVGSVRAAAQAAGRDPDAITICVAAPAYVGTDLAHQRDQLRWFGGMVGNHVADLVARYGEDGPVPHELTDYIKGREGYDYSHHGRAGNPSTDFVPDAIVDRFCLLGPAEAHLDRLRELAEIGADQFAVYLMHDQPAETLAAYGGHDHPGPGLTARTAGEIARPGRATDEHWSERSNGCFGVSFFIAAVSGSGGRLAIFGILGCRKHPAYVMAADSSGPAPCPRATS